MAAEILLEHTKCLFGLLLQFWTFQDSGILFVHHNKP